MHCVIMITQHSSSLKGVNLLQSAEKQTPLQKIRGPRMARLIATNATDERMVKITETNKQAQNGLAQVHTKHFKRLQVFP